MRLIRQLPVVLLLLLLGQSRTAAQELLWSADFVGFFDNREYKSEYQQSQTLFATRISPEIGIGLDGNRHRIMAGVSWIQPLGSSINESMVRPTAYYRYVGSSFRMSIGAFPRTQLLASQSDAFVYDSLRYFRPNIQGALFQYSGRNGYAEAYIDWRSMQTRNRREAFLIGLQGEFRSGVWLAGGEVQMNHLARTKGAPESISVMDDILLHPTVGLNLSRCTPLDSLALRVGYLLGLQRNRGIGTWHHPQGGTADLVLQWRWLGLKNTLYVGQNQYPFYPEFGPLLNQGDPFYQARFYNCTRLYAYLFRNPYVNCLASFNIHCNAGKTDLQQQLVVRVYVDRHTWKHKPERLLPNIF